MEFSNEVTIDRPAREVFDYVSDLENVPRWNYAIEQTTKVTDGPVGVGTTYRQVRSLPRRSEETLRVTEFQPPRRLSVRGGLGPFEGTLAYELEDLGRSTRLTNRADLEARGLVKLAAPIVAGRVREAVAKNLDTLKHLLEAGTP